MRVTIEAMRQAGLIYPVTMLQHRTIPVAASLADRSASIPASAALETAQHA